MVTKTRMSLADFLALKECKPYLELIDGEVVPKSMAGRKHSRIVTRLLFLLVGYLDASLEGTADTELRHLERAEEWVFLPDISVTCPR